MNNVIGIIMGRESIDILDNKTNDSEQYYRWKNILLILIKQSKSYVMQGLTEKNLELVLTKFENFYINNEILNKYVVEGEIDFTIVENQVISFFDSLADKLGIEKEEDITTTFNKFNIEDFASTQDKGISLVKSNGKSLLTEDKQKRGYVGAFLLATLTASVEISTILYIIYNAM
ncbi:MAG: hypothetical protein PHN42_02610 [Bacilli bacterium]|nr:hypothetical protein [Bacilli bacterium]